MVEQAAGERAVLQDRLDRLLVFARNGEATEKVLPQLPRANLGPAHAEHAQIRGVADDGLVCVPRHVVEDRRQALRGRAFGEPIAQATVGQGLDDRAHRGGDGDVGDRGFLGVEHSDLQRAPIEAEDGTSAVQPLGLEKLFGVVGFDGSVHREEHDSLVLVAGLDRFGNHLPADLADATMAITRGVCASVEVRTSPTVEEGGRGGQGGHDRQHQAHRVV